MEPSAGMVHDLILDRHLRRLDARLLLRNEVGIPRNSVHQVNELAHDGHERPFRSLRSRHPLPDLPIVRAENVIELH